jgi:uncharacterized glyoxalase superfamily protein PhnB
MTPYKPDSYTSVSPYLVVDDPAATIAFLVRAFDAVELRRFSAPDGRIVHAEVRIDDTVVMLGGALEAGATSVQAPIKRNDPDKRSGVRDTNGTTWWLATMVG